ncbi:MAG: hypothetical protein PHX16_02520 [Syntrophaceticus sp.]|nr:hypothetical protein [Syntrophaceticus sp.]MDD4359965.1 hypothetical protein [Syntrophaceticus sp.]MDD4782508.1 hypothetical protein [Syntrophaceticus sp.]
MSIQPYPKASRFPAKRPYGVPGNDIRCSEDAGSGCEDCSSKLEVINSHYSISEFRSSPERPEARLDAIRD